MSNYLVSANDLTTISLGEQDTVTSVLQNLSLIHISEPTRRTPISYAVFCLKKKKYKNVTVESYHNTIN